MQRNLTLVLALVLVLALGLWGQYELSPMHVRLDFFDALYEVIMLFALEGDWTRGVMLPWQLEVARVLAPMVSVAGVLIVLTRGAWVGLTNYFIRFRRDHVVVIGLGEKGFQFARSCAQHHRVVVVEMDAENPTIARARDLGIAVVLGDILSTDVLRMSGVRTARHVVTFCGNDGASVEIALRIRDYLRRIRSDRELRIHLHVKETRVSSRLEHYSKFYDDVKVAEVNFFSVNDLSARILLQQYPPDVFANVQGQTQVHIALYKFGTLAEHILTEAVRICHFLNGRRLKFSIIDRDAAEKARSLLSLHPGLNELCEIHYVEMPFLHPLQLDEVDSEFLASITEHVVCLDNDDENLELALMLREILLSRQGCNAPINVRMQRSSGLAKLLEAQEDEPEIPDGIYPFGMLDEALYYDNILSDRLDELARALHHDYLSRRSDVETDMRLYSTLNSWARLPEPDRKSSRLQADHLGAKLRSVRCAQSKGPANDFAFSDTEAEFLARMEHERWLANKIYEGWRQGSDRVERAKINPFTVPWESIDLLERQEQVDAIKRLPGLLQSRLGWSLQREVTIGITGHRPHRVDLGNRKLLAAIDRALSEFSRANRGSRQVVVSPLAEGSDRVVARMAMDKYGMALRVPLPLPFELYQTDFSTAESLQEFKELVGRAESYFEIPTLFGTIETLASRTDGAPNEDRSRQYALVGAYIAQSCDQVLAIYDGGEPLGIGGTAEVVRWRQTGQLPEEYRLESAFFLRPEMVPPIVIDPDGH